MTLLQKRMLELTSEPYEIILDDNWKEVLIPTEDALEREHLEALLLGEQSWQIFTPQGGQR